MAFKKYKFRGKIIIIISIVFLLISTTIQISPLFKNDDLDLTYNYINIKDIAVTSIAVKTSNNSIVDNLFSGVEKEDNVLANVEETKLPLVENTVATTPQVIWRLPTEMGYVTQNPHYGHVALDIGSPRGSSEAIFPIANGVVSGKYYDPAGALVVTIHHNINGQDYTSQYAHLSRFADNLYVGKPVTVNDYIGYMGTTGNSTGVHLHIALVDCNLFGDNKCPDLNSFFRYANYRYNQGFTSLWAVMIVPGSWTSR